MDLPHPKDAKYDTNKDKTVNTAEKESSGLKRAKKNEDDITWPKDIPSKKAKVTDDSVESVHSNIVVQNDIKDDFVKSKTISQSDSGNGNKKESDKSILKREEQNDDFEISGLVENSRQINDQYEARIKRSECSSELHGFVDDQKSQDKGDKDKHLKDDDESGTDKSQNDNELDIDKSNLELDYDTEKFNVVIGDIIGSSLFASHGSSTQQIIPQEDVLLPRPPHAPAPPPPDLLDQQISEFLC